MDCKTQKIPDVNISDTRLTVIRNDEYYVADENKKLAVDKLAAYENTRLTPDQVDQIRRAAEYMMFESTGDFVRYAIANFEELQRLKNCNTGARHREQPLTLDELKQMTGQPVFVKILNHDIFKDPKDDFDGWGLVRHSWVRQWDKDRADLISIDHDFETYGIDWLAYATDMQESRWCKDGDFLICLNCESEINVKNSLGVENHRSYCPNCGKPMAGQHAIKKQKG